MPTSCHGNRVPVVADIIVASFGRPTIVPSWPERSAYRRLSRWTMTYRRRRILRQIAPTATLLLTAAVILVGAFALGRRLSDSQLAIVILVVVVLIISAIALPVTFRQRCR